MRYTTDPAISDNHSTPGQSSKCNRKGTERTRTQEHLPEDVGESVTGHWLVGNAVFLSTPPEDGLL